MLENPAILDAVNIVPVEIDQKLEDAEADEQEKNPEIESVTPKYDEFTRLQAIDPASAFSFWRENQDKINEEMSK